MKQVMVLLVLQQLKNYTVFHHDGKGVQRRIRSAILWSDVSLPLRNHKKPPMEAECIFFESSKPSLEEMPENYLLNK